MRKLRFRRKISKEETDKLNYYIAIFLAGLVGFAFILFIGILGGWLSLGAWISSLSLFGVCCVVFYLSLNKQQFKKLVGCMLLCIIFATPIYALSATVHDQSIAQNLQNQKSIDYFKNLLGRSYNYTELIVWENQQLNFSGAQRSDDPIRIYENHQGMCGEYATLYAELCISQGYRCRIVDNIFNDHAFNEVLQSNGTWIRIDSSLNSTGPRAIGYPMFFEKEPGWLPPALSLAFENSSITEVTSTYRSDGFEVLSPTTIIVMITLFAFSVVTIRNELFAAPKDKPAEETEVKEKVEIEKDEEKERDKLIYEIIIKRYDQEGQRTNDLDSKANNTIGFSGILATLIATVVGVLSKGTYTVLFTVPLSLLIISAILGLLAYRVKTYEAIEPSKFIEEYKDQTLQKTLRNYTKTIADRTLVNHKVHEDKAKLIKYSTALLVLAITLFFVIAISNWLV